MESIWNKETNLFEKVFVLVKLGMLVFAGVMAFVINGFIYEEKKEKEISKKEIE